MLIRAILVCLCAVPALAGPEVLRSRHVDVDAAGLLAAETGDVIDLPLFEDRIITIELLDRTRKARDRVRWLGAVPGSPGSVAVIAVKTDALAAYVTLGDEVYQVRGTLVEQLDTERFPACTIAPPALDIGDADAVGVAGDDPVRIDLLVCYTAAARVDAGGDNAMLSLIDVCEGLTNLALTESLTEAEVRVVGAYEVAYVESQDLSTDLSRLRAVNDGFMDDVHPLRDALGADHVHLIVEDFDQAGVAYLMSNVGPGFASSCFAVSDVDAAAGNLTFPHEIGHNMGCCHHTDDAGCQSGGAYPWSRGHRFTGGNDVDYRTVMAYSPGVRIPRYSNPDVEFVGTPTGIPIGDPGQSNNGLSIFFTRTTVAAFRAEACDVDLNGDGELSVLDFIAFQQAFVAEDTIADCNEDGSHTILDFICFQAAFQAGCD